VIGSCDWSCTDSHAEAAECKRGHLMMAVSKSSVTASEEALVFSTVLCYLVMLSIWFAFCRVMLTMAGITTVRCDVASSLPIVWWGENHGCPLPSPTLEWAWFVKLIRGVSSPAQLKGPTIWLVIPLSNTLFHIHRNNVMVDSHLTPKKKLNSSHREY